MIVIDASSLNGAALKSDSIPWQALVWALEWDRIAMSDDVAAEIRGVPRRSKFANVMTPQRIAEVEALLFAEAASFVPAVSVTDCRDPKDNKYLELALASDASVLVSSDNDLLSLDPWRGVRILRPAAYLATG